jgi:hypothetical protein
MKTAWALLITLPLAACFSLAPTRPEPSVRQFLDDRTAVTITTATEPSVLVRELPWVAAHGKEYIEAGLVEINRSGDHHWYLRLAIWSTVDLADELTLRTARFQKLLLLADGDAIELVPSAWSDREAGLSKSPYPSPVDDALLVYLPMTRSQANLFASAHEISIVADPHGEALTYALRLPESPARALFTRYLGSVTGSARETANTTNHREQ